MNIREAVRRYTNQRGGKNAKAWCKANPGKKMLLARTTGSIVISYYAGSKCFIFSPAKPVQEKERTIDIDWPCLDPKTYTGIVMP